MKNPFDYFEEIWVINLDSRTDRWQHAQEEFKKVGILDRVQRFSAIRHPDGRIGLIKSNVEIIKGARERKLNNILIFEDDFEFLINNPLEILQKSIDQAKGINWYLFYLGANTHQKLLKFKPNLILLKAAFATHSLAYSKLAFDPFLNRYENMEAIRKHDDILDVFCATYFQENFICLMANPMMTTQMNSFSDIEGSFVNYDFIKERYKNNIK
jgi:GR25 family glycosyltransferase involved in LPS biosynthesis